MSDAAFREALDALVKEGVNLFEARQMRHPETDKWEVAYNRLLARVLALYAERQGAEWWMVTIPNDPDPVLFKNASADLIAAWRGDGNTVDRVRVVKCEEGQ